MKNLVIIVIIIFGAWYFYNLWENKTLLEDAKKDLGVIESNNSDIKIAYDNKIEEDKLKNDEKTEESNSWKTSYTIKNLDDKNFIEIDDLSEKVKDLTEKIKLSWKVLNSEVDKIVIKFKNMTSDFPNDTYELQGFKKWDTSFEYNADSKLYRNLDYWVNVFIVEAYIWDDVSVIQIDIIIPDNLWEVEEKVENISDEVTYDKKLIGSGDDALYIWLPSSELFWNPLNLDDGIITYSNIEWFEMKKDDFNIELKNNEDIWNSDWTGYLNENVPWYVYWNTLRPVDSSNKDAWTSFYVLRNTTDKFIYEKYYFDFNHSILGILKIKEFDKNEDSISDQMSKLNNELKEQNDEFEIIKTTDKLFIEIVR